MEEKKDKATEKMSYEQLENVAMQLQQKLMMAENNLRGINYTAMRLTWLFKTIENKGIFPEDFVTKCVAEIQEILTIEENEQSGTVADNKK